MLPASSDWKHEHVRSSGDRAARRLPGRYRRDQRGVSLQFSVHGTNCGVWLKQLDRLKVMQPSSAEYTVTRTYLEWLVELPWSISTDDQLDINEARKMLDADHYGLEKVKKRILEYLAVRKLKGDKKGPILCLAVPPASARPRSAARSPAPWAASSCASRSAACATRPRSAATGAPTSARCPAGHPEHEEGRQEQPGLHARRDRQARPRLPGRPGGGPARGARPRAEPRLRRSLPRGPLRPLAR